MVFIMLNITSDEALAPDGYEEVGEIATFFKNTNLNTELLQGRIDADFLTEFGSSKSAWKLVNTIAPIELEAITKMKYGGAVRRSGIVEKFDSLIGGQAAGLELGFDSYEPNNSEDTSYSMFWFINIEDKLDTGNILNYDSEMIQILYNLQQENPETMTKNGVFNKIGWEKILNSIEGKILEEGVPSPWEEIWEGKIHWNDKYGYQIVGKWDDYKRIRVYYEGVADDGCQKSTPKTLIFEIDTFFENTGDKIQLATSSYGKTGPKCFEYRFEVNFTRNNDTSFKFHDVEGLDGGGGTFPILTKIEGEKVVGEEPTSRYENFANEKVEVEFYIDVDFSKKNRREIETIGAKAADVRSLEIGGIFNDSYEIKFSNENKSQTGPIIKSASPNLRNQTLTRKLFLF